MILPLALAFLVGVLVEATVLWRLDRRAIAQEKAFWEDLRVQALDGYGRVFDWAREPDL